MIIDYKKGLGKQPLSGFYPESIKRRLYFTDIREEWFKNADGVLQRMPDPEDLDAAVRFVFAFVQRDSPHFKERNLSMRAKAIFDELDTTPFVRSCWETSHYWLMWIIGEALFMLNDADVTSWIALKRNLWHQMQGLMEDPTASPDYDKAMSTKIKLQDSITKLQALIKDLEKRIFASDKEADAANDYALSRFGGAIGYPEFFANI